MLWCCGAFFVCAWLFRWSIFLPTFLNAWHHHFHCINSKLWPRTSSYAQHWQIPGAPLRKLCLLIILESMFLGRQREIKILIPAGKGELRSAWVCSQSAFEFLKLQRVIFHMYGSSPAAHLWLLLHISANTVQLWKKLKRPLHFFFLNQHLYIQYMAAIPF